MQTFLKSALERIDLMIDYSMRSIIIVITVMASCTMLAQVIVRYVFELAISGLDEVTGHTAVWLYLMGAAYGSFDRSQIKAEMIHLIVKNQRVLNSIRSIASMISVLVSGYMVVWSFGYIRWSLMKGEVTPTLQIPTVLFQFSILVGAVLMVFYFVRETFDFLKDTFHPETAAS